MLPETNARLRTAAKLRAAGATWEAVGQRLDRDPSTCRRWPSRYRAEWNTLQEAAALRTTSAAPRPKVPAAPLPPMPHRDPPQFPRKPSHLDLTIALFVLIAALVWEPAF